jgi:hypothetical protein
MRRALFSGNHPAIARSLSNLGTSYMNLGEEKNVRKGIRYLEEALRMFKALYPYNHIDLASSLGNLGTAYEDLGDHNKALEYYKQAYGIWLALFGENHKDTKLAKQNIIALQPEFFTRQGFAQKLQECHALRGNPVGLESRKVILSHSTNKAYNLIDIQQRIQETVLSKIVRECHNSGWQAISGSGSCGVNTYLEPAFLKKALGDLGNDSNNIELAQMLCFESISLGIMKSGKKRYSLAGSFCRVYTELAMKIATEYPEFFVDGSVVEACIKALPKQSVLADLLKEKVKYMAEDRDESRGAELLRL